MKTFYKLFSVMVFTLILAGCSDDDSVAVNIESPTNLDMAFSFDQENPGVVTITPSAEGANEFLVSFGDGSGSSDQFDAGTSITHTYEEGTYDVQLTAYNTNGDFSQFTEELVVDFENMPQPPANLEVTITQNEDDPFTFTVEATADNATSFTVDFGNDETATFEPDGSAEVTYASAGTYTITVTAENDQGSVEYTEEVTIEDQGDDDNDEDEPIEIPLTFEGNPENYVFTEFEGAPTMVVDNPDMSGENTSAQVVQVTREQGAANYAGSFIVLDSSPDLMNNSAMTMKVWSPEAGIPVTLRFEQPDNSDVGVEAAATTSVANQWETLTFDFSNTNVPAGDISKMVVFFNLGTDGQGNTYYYDDVEYSSGNGDNGGDDGNTGLYFDFEDSPDSYMFTEFGGQPIEIINNPDMSGINTSAQVAQVTKVEGAGPYAGAFMDLSEEPDLSNATITMKVWSPEAGIPIILKFENIEDSPNGAEETVMTTVANEWETLTFNLDADVSQGDYTRMVLLFNAGNAGQGNVYYFDDIELQ